MKKGHSYTGYKPKGCPSLGQGDPLSSTKPFSSGPGSNKGAGPNKSFPQSDHESPVIKPGKMKGK